MARSTTAPEDAGGPQFRQSPIGYFIERNLGAQRLEDREAVDKFPLFQELRALGITEYSCNSCGSVKTERDGEAERPEEIA